MITIKKRSFLIIIISFVICIGVIMTLCVEQSRGAIKNSFENNDRTVTGLISNAIDNYFLRPITVVETISKDYSTKEILNIHSKEEALKMENHAADFLRSIRDGFGYYMVYAVSEPARTYFTYNGISKYMDPENDFNDLWYKNFCASDELYSLDVDIDTASNWSLSVFINRAVYDDDGNFIGVCGVGIDMLELQRLLERYERIYDVKISLINKDGLIMVDRDVSKIETDYILIDNLSSYSDGEYYYETLNEGSRSFTYIENLDWYVVVQKNSTWINYLKDIIIPCAICFVICIIIMTLCLKYGVVKIEQDSESSILN